MRSLLLPLVLLSFGLSVSCDPAVTRWSVHERRSDIPAGWTLSRKHDPSAIIPLRFGLTQSNLESLEEFVYDVAHPKSPNFGKHWSPSKVASTFAPSSETVDAVRNWLLESGIEADRVSLATSGGWLEFTATVQEAEGLLRTSYNVYSHETGVEHIACESYHLPEHLMRHVDIVTPTVHFDTKLPKRDGQTFHSLGAPDSGNGPTSTGEITDLSFFLDQLEHCDDYTTPACLRALYGFIYEPVVSGLNSYGIVEFTPQSYHQSDLDMFARNYSSDLIGVSPVMVSVDGGALSNQSSFDINGESDLDLEYAMNLVTVKQNVTLYQLGDLVEGASFNNFLDALDKSYCAFEGGDDPTQDAIYPDNHPGGYKAMDCGTVKPANVISNSYGYNEADLTFFYADRQCKEYGKLALMGVTVLFSSGDFGVAGNSKKCLNPDQSQTTSGKIFNPSFPSTCPWVTSVGATQLYPGQNVFDEESSCETVISSGGGFSNYFGLPDYQKDAVTGYLENHPPAYPPDIWNSTGKSRAYPDVSANGANYVTAVDGKFQRVYGTSASTPVFGAMITMVNDARIAVGMGPIGFLNYHIYDSSCPGSWHDIINGTNPGCGTKGYNTSVGWDPVTGMGTPNFPVLLRNLLGLGDPSLATLESSIDIDVDLSVR